MANNSRFTQIYKGTGTSRRDRAGVQQASAAKPARQTAAAGSDQQASHARDASRQSSVQQTSEQPSSPRQASVQDSSAQRPVRISTDQLPEIDGSAAAPQRASADTMPAASQRTPAHSAPAASQRTSAHTAPAASQRTSAHTAPAASQRTSAHTAPAASQRTSAYPALAASQRTSARTAPAVSERTSARTAPATSQRTPARTAPAASQHTSVRTAPAASQRTPARTAPAASQRRTPAGAASGIRRPPVSSQRTGRPPVIPPEGPSAGGSGSHLGGGTRRKGGVRRVLFRIFQVLLALFVAGSLSCAAIGLYYIFTVIKKAPDISDVTVSPNSAATYIYDQAGKREQKLTLPEANRDLVSIVNVPIDLQHAFVAVEDSRFYQHNGIDPKGIVRAFWHGVTTGSFDEGASTITQQLLKNTVFTSWTSEKSFLDRLDRKIQEQYLAIQLEKVMTKDQIMEDYLNVINLGAGCYGVQSAAFRYFGKDVSELTLSECAVIAGITQNPTFYNPITYPDNNAGKMKTVLNLMLAQDYITEGQRSEALADPVYERIQSNEDTTASEVSIYTYYQDALIDQVIEDLVNERGFAYKQAVKAVYAGGLRIYSAQDTAIQKICDEEFANPSNFPAGTEAGIDYALSIESSSGEVTHYGNEHLISFMRKTSDPSFNLMFTTEAQAREGAAAFKASVLKDGDTVLGERITVTPQPQASVTVIDPETGYVRALVGGRGKKEASLTLNRASYTTRQPGSTFKILAAYAPAIDSCGKTLATIYENTPFSYEDGTPVNNWDLKTTSGPVTIRQAIAQSINIAAVRCITEITPRLGYSYAKAMGISSLVENYNNGSETLTDVTQSLALGGITLGVTNLELCSAYACIANSGMYIEPKFYTKVLDTYGNTILDNTSPVSQAVLKSSTAALLTSAMEDVISDPSGTAYGTISLGGMPVAGKSGTTSDYRDIWFAGFTPYYACCVWGGYDNNAALPDSGLYHSYNKVLWNSIMNRIHKDLPLRSFYVPSDVVSAEICDTTGMAAAAGCPAHHTELFSAETQPMYYCSVHGSGNIVSGVILPQTAFTGNNGQGNDIVIIEDGSNTWTFTPGSSTVIDTGSALTPDPAFSDNTLTPDTTAPGNTLTPDTSASGNTLTPDITSSDASGGALSPDDAGLSQEVIEILNGIPEAH